MKNIGAVEMRLIAAGLESVLNGDDEHSIGFALLIFPFNQPGVTNYVSNADRADMIIAMKETIVRFENNETFPTPEEN